MTPERWVEIEDLFHRALECEPEERDRLLDDSSRGDTDIRRRILDHAGIVQNCATGALARLGLARAKARTTYQDFRTLWKDADPDISILKQAKAEYAKLQ